MTCPASHGPGSLGPVGTGLGAGAAVAPTAVDAMKATQHSRRGRPNQPSVLVDETVAQWQPGLYMSKWRQ